MRRASPAVEVGWGTWTPTVFTPILLNTLILFNNIDRVALNVYP